jgi:hypothetical protein
MIALIWFFGAHGVIVDGKQCILINDFDEKLKFYQIWRVESVIRGLSKRRPNSFSITIFACCREVLDGKQNTGYLPGPYLVAKAKLDERMQADEETKKKDQSEANTAKLLEEANKTIEQLKQQLETREEPDEPVDAPAEAQVAVRGKTSSFLPPVQHENFVFVSGCAPSSGVKADTKIVEDLKIIFMQFDIASLTLRVPDVFDSFSGQDASFEILVSGTAQVLKLHFEGDLVVKSIAVIFVTDRLKAPESRSRLKDLVYTDAVEKGKKYEQLFKLLGVDEVIIRLNISKVEMISQFDGIQAISDEFEKTATSQSRLLLGIVTLGFKLNCN